MNDISAIQVSALFYISWYRRES